MENRNKFLTIILLIIVLFNPNSSFSQLGIEKGAYFDSLNIELKEWIIKNSENLYKGIVQFEKKDSLHFRISRKNGELSYQYELTNKAYQKFKKRSWIKMISLSSHENPDIGDVTLAITNKGKVYINRGHICGNVVTFHSQNKLSRLTALKFLTNYTEYVDEIPFEYVMTIK